VCALFVANSHRSLYESLTRDADLSGVTARVTESRENADMILHLNPPWPDPEAPDRKLRARDVGRTFVFDQSDMPIAWAPGAYASLRASRASRATTGGFYFVEHDPEALSDRLELARAATPDLLWSFVGTVGNHAIRRKVVEIADNEALLRDTQRWNDTVRWAWRKAHRVEAQTLFASYAEAFGRSSFIVCPRGVGPGSIRVFEAMQAGRCPVIVSDEWVPPMCVEWTSCSIRVPEAKVADIPSILRARAADAATLGAAARAAWERCFAPKRQLATLIETCTQVDGSLTGRLVCLERCMTTPEVNRRLLSSSRRRMVAIRNKRHVTRSRFRNLREL
jgi:exostosin family protein